MPPKRPRLQGPPISERLEHRPWPTWSTEEPAHLMTRMDCRTASSPPPEDESRGRVEGRLSASGVQCRPSLRRGCPAKTRPREADEIEASESQPVPCSTLGPLAPGRRETLSDRGRQQKRPLRRMGWKLEIQLGIACIPYPPSRRARPSALSVWPQPLDPLTP